MPWLRQAIGGNLALQSQIMLHRRKIRVRGAAQSSLRPCRNVFTRPRPEADMRTLLRSTWTKPKIPLAISTTTIDRMSGNLRRYAQFATGGIVRGGGEGSSDGAMTVLVLDCDGVVVKGHREGGRWDKHLVRDLGVDAAALQERFFKPHWKAIALGEADMREMLEREHLGLNREGFPNQRECG